MASDSDRLPRVLNVKEVATYLHVHESSIYRLLKHGKLPGAFKMGSDWRFERVEIDRWRLGQTATVNSKNER